MAKVIQRIYVAFAKLNLFFHGYLFKIINKMPTGTTVKIQYS